MSRPDDAPGLVSGTPEGAAAYTLAANPLVGVRGQDIVDAARVLMAQMARNPGVIRSWPSSAGLRAAAPT
jgi:hypothetical protein